MKFAELGKKQKSAFFIGLAVLLMLLAGWGVYAAFFSTPKPKSHKPEDLARFIASDGFRKIPEQQQHHYMEQLRQTHGDGGPDRMREIVENLSEAERRAFFDNMRRVHEAERAKEALAYLKMSQEEKDAFLDRKIEEFDRRHAEMEKHRAQREKAQQNGGDQEKRQEGPRPDFAAMRKMHMESTAPEVRAAFDTMMRDMMARRKATGKSMPEPPGPPPR